jgi:hypothetical protein
MQSRSLLSMGCQKVEGEYIEIFGVSLKKCETPLMDPGVVTKFVFEFGFKLERLFEKKNKNQHCLRRANSI